MRLAQEVSYSNAGTVEYLFDVGGSNGFFFLELNPRLQVEHPVTEMITRVNLPACQLQVAMGIPLHRIPDIRKLYGRPAFSTSTIDFEEEQQVPTGGHCIAARITAENPDLGFQPTSGLIEELNFRSTPDVWGYFSVDSSGLVHEFADSQFGHLFAGGADREAARKSMIMALKELSIRGDIRTTVEYLVTLMQSDDFISNRITTAWLDSRIASPAVAQRDMHRPSPLFVVAHGALVTAFQATEARSAQFVATLGKGHYPPEALLTVDQPIELIYEDVKYQLRAAQTGAPGFAISCPPSLEYVQGEVRQLSDGGFLVQLAGKSQVVYSTVTPAGLRLTMQGRT